MDLNELILKKGLAENAIAKILDTFQESIELTIHDVNISFIDVTTHSSSIKEQKARVEIIVKL